MEIRENIKKEIIGVFKKHLDLEKYNIFFFGSRVKGDNFSKADIDIGVEGATQMPVALKAKIEEDLGRINTLLRFDLVDFSNVSDEFKKEAKKNIEYVK